MRRKSKAAASHRPSSSALRDWRGLSAGNLPARAQPTRTAGARRWPSPGAGGCGSPRRGIPSRSGGCPLLFQHGLLLRAACGARRDPPTLRRNQTFLRRLVDHQFCGKRRSRSATSWSLPSVERTCQPQVGHRPREDRRDRRAAPAWGSQSRARHPRPSNAYSVRVGRTPRALFASSAGTSPGSMPISAIRPVDREPGSSAW